MRRSTRFLTAIAAIATVALVMTACGDDKKETTAPGGTSAQSGTTAKDDALAAMVPKAIADKGTLSVGSDTSYAPNEFLGDDNKTPQGMTVDLIGAVASVLGLEANVQTSDFSAIIPGITQSKKFDVGASSFTINPERLQQVDMISYFSAGTRWAQPKGAAIDPENACGKKIAVQTGTVQVDDITARNTTCTEAGKPAIQIDQYDKQDAATNAVVSGKDDAMLADSPVIDYAVKQLPDKLEAAGESYGNAPYGFAIAKDNGDLGKALQGAVVKLIGNGEYEKILTKWGVEAGAVTAADVQINPPVS